MTDHVAAITEDVNKTLLEEARRSHTLPQDKEGQRLIATDKLNIRDEAGPLMEKIEDLLDTGLPTRDQEQELDKLLKDLDFQVGRLGQKRWYSGDLSPLRRTRGY